MGRPWTEAHGAWTLTGRQSWRQGWFGQATPVLEETRRVWRPVFTGYTPANWRLETRWRKARFDEVQPPEAWMLPRTTLDIPMPAGAKPPGSASQAPPSNLG